MALVQMNFESEKLQGNTTISVILPDKPRGKTPEQFYGSEEKYKVLWLLHGTYGDHSDWIRKSNIELYACERDLIVVMPSGLNANYANWEHFSIGYNMYDFLWDELMPLIYGWFPASRRREDNFVAGLSMGGRGTSVYAFNHPEKFAGAAILSSAPQDLDWLKENHPQMWPRTQGSIDNRGGEEAYRASYEYVWRILDEKVAAGVDLPQLYFACGRQDFLYEGFRHFRTHAEEIGLDATFEEIDGYRHEWRFWDLTIQKALDFFGIPMAGAGNPF
ncbi:hypothetical protein LJC63_02410 [Ruminococcaceae bacterium OttesenSCG-928-L11]|nr:hypothetical protein [Ruminococcaceae bacterium OttesenSCG-928-L11]